MSFKALGLDENFRSVLMGMISIPKAKFWGFLIFKNQTEETDSSERTLTMCQH